MSFANALKMAATIASRPSSSMMANRAPAAVRAQFSRAAPALRAPAPLRAIRKVHATPALAKYGAEKKGDYPSMEFRIFFNEDGKAISPWHGVPLHNADGTCNFICEIPKETKAKMEVATDEELTPIKQDTKKGKLRDYPYNINWNYGMLPQTWEDPGHEHPEMKVMGDNDPVVRIGSTLRSPALSRRRSSRPRPVACLDPSSVTERQTHDTQLCGGASTTVILPLILASRAPFSSFPSGRRRTERRSTSRRLRSRGTRRA